MNQTIYVYAHVPSRKAYALAYEIKPTVETAGRVVLLFKCPREWVPQSQETFNRACEYNGFLCGPSFDWNPTIHEP